MHMSQSNIRNEPVRLKNIRLGTQAVQPYFDKKLWKTFIDTIFILTFFME